MDEGEHKVVHAMRILKPTLAGVLDEKGWAINEGEIQRKLREAICASYGVEPSVVELEFAGSGQRTDIKVRVSDTVIELKYARQHPGLGLGGNQPGTKRYGPVLDDMNKLARTPGAERFMVLVTAPALVRYAIGRGGNIWPLKVGEEKIVRSADLVGMAPSVQRRAVKRGAWPDMILKCVYRDQIDTWEMVVWEVRPLT